MAEQIAEQTSRTEKDSRDTAEPNDYPRPQSRRRFIVLGVIAALVVIAGLFWWHSTYYEDTDDAQVDGHLIQISSRIAGQVIKVNVDENQFVPANTVVVEIDPKDFEVAVQQDQAALDSALASYQAATVNVPVTGINTRSTLHSANADVGSSQAQVDQAIRQLDSAKAKVVQAEANNTKAQLDLQRYTPLVQKDMISRQQYDEAVAAAGAQKAGVVDAQAAQAAAAEGVRVARERLAQSQAQARAAQTGPQQVAIQKARADQAAAQVQQARATLEQAKLNLSYTKIVTPVAGIVTRKSVELGQNASVGQNMMTLVSLDDIWITANFKETQLKHMRPGQPVSVHVDAYGRKFDGKVTQIGGATGSVLSLFPPENATGNYVKVVQRVPVRIDLINHDQNKDHVLRPGLSVEPKVRVKE